MDHSPDKKTESVEWDPSANGPSLALDPNHSNSKAGRMGFVNSGNMCYISTAIHLLSHVIDVTLSFVEQYKEMRIRVDPSKLSAESVVTNCFFSYGIPLGS